MKERKEMLKRADDPGKVMDYRKYAEAVMFAMERHRGQTRDDGTPYISHPLRVAESLRALVGCQDIDILCAAVLHDTIEDTKTSFDDLERRFGCKVATWVSELTVDKRLPKPERARQMLESAPRKSRESRLIKLADRLDNLSDMAKWAASRKKAYLESSKALLEVHRGVNPVLEDLLEEKIRELKKEVEK